MIRVDVAVDCRNVLGEGPMWNTQEQCLYWVDALAPAIHRLDPATGEQRFWPMPADIGSFVFLHNGRLIGGMRSGFNLIDLENSNFTPLVNPVASDERLMLNDGKCDRAGRYWCGSVHSDFIGRQAALFRLDGDLQCRRMDDGFIIGNGIAFSPDDKTLYFSDTRAETVYAYDFDLAAGEIANRRVFFHSDGIEGRVDGATVDTDGNYWCALVHGGAIACIDPGGQLIQRIELPVKHPTMCTFGGPDLDILYVTSARSLQTAEQEPHYPLAGALFMIENTGAKGLPEPFFSGRFEKG